MFRSLAKPFTSKANPETGVVSATASVPVDGAEAESVSASEGSGISLSELYAENSRLSRQLGEAQFALRSVYNIVTVPFAEADSLGSQSTAANVQTQEGDNGSVSQASDSLSVGPGSAGAAAAADLLGSRGNSTASASASSRARASLALTFDSVRALLTSVRLITYDYSNYRPAEDVEQGLTTHGVPAATFRLVKLFPQAGDVQQQQDAISLFKSVYPLLMDSKLVSVDLGGAGYYGSVFWFVFLSNLVSRATRERVDRFLVLQHVPPATASKINHVFQLIQRSENE